MTPWKDHTSSSLNGRSESTRRPLTLAAGLTLEEFPFAWMTIISQLLSYFWPEDYLTLAWGSRRALAKIRMSAHPLAIETGRYSSDSDMYDRRCQLCTCNDLNLLRHLPEFDPVVESEWHLLCACPYYHDLRSELPDWILSELFQGTAIASTWRLYSKLRPWEIWESVRRALERRREFLDSRPWGPSTFHLLVELVNQ